MGIFAKQILLIQDKFIHFLIIHRITYISIKNCPARRTVFDTSPILLKYGEANSFIKVIFSCFTNDWILTKSNHCVIMMIEKMKKYIIYSVEEKV